MRAPVNPVMRYIVIVYGASSAMLYVEEAINRGFKPIIVNPPLAYDPQEENFRLAVGDKAIYIKGKSLDDQSDVIAELKKYDIACIVPGAAAGVTYAERLIDAMGFEGNGYDSLWRRDSKRGMHQSLKEAGIRYIKSTVVTNDDDIKKFFEENDIKSAFMKYSEGASSYGAKKCDSIEEAIKHFHDISDKKNSFGWNTDVLLQEFIGGDEYIVNSVSCRGKHLITDIWKYRKVLTEDKEMIYESMELLMSVEPGIHDLIIYAYKVLDATGFKIGPCHGEFKIDEKGPVLIETNPRPMGASMTSRYLDECLGHHITDIAMDAYLDKKKFMMRLLKPYRPLKMAALKFMISPRETDANLAPIMEILHGLKSFRQTNPLINDEIVHITKTVDLETSPIMIKLCHEDENLLHKEVEFLHELETKYFDLLASVNDKIPETKVATHDWIKEYAPPTSRMLFARTDGDSLFHLGKETAIDRFAVWDTYDAIVFMNASEGTLMEKLRVMRYYMSQLRNGGYFVIVPEVFKEFPYGSVGMEILLHVLDCKVEVPPMNTDGAIFAIKN